MALAVFHLGFPKTGTTTIQSTISVNRKLILQSCWFLLHGGNTRRLRKASLQFQRLDRKEDRSNFFDLLQGVGEKISQSGREKALISDEMLVASDMYRDGCLDYVQSAERVLPLIEEAMPQHDVRFVFYSRNMEKWLSSAYQQFVKTRRLVVTKEEWISKITFPLDWNAIGKQLQAATDRPVEFVAMESEIGPDKVLGAHLFKLVGFSDEEISSLKIPPLKNASLSPGALEFMLAANASEIDRKDMWKIRKLVIDNPDCFK